ncbi:peroxiredoxin-like family protein [Roseiconus lacunae]|uniref:SelL-related redox protein n=1 Tax=Roseiconus lacunae TaxID=2605694 RepID=UPI00308C60CB|nr:peroxiredoxin-like family protein [Stieleria sp. HD01]
MNQTTTPHPSPRWYATILNAAATYNLVWGAWVVLRPGDFFDWFDLTPPAYPAIWQCVGMIVGVYGIGYAIAARNPLRHWPLVLVGFLGKALGPIGIAWNVLQGDLSPAWVWITVFNDLVWLFPFAAILFAAIDHANRPAASTDDQPAERLNELMRTHRGDSIASLSVDRSVLVVFLRHAGCTFCREALGDLQKQRAGIEAAGGEIVLVHMGDNERDVELFESYGLADAHRISDPGCCLYRAYGLQRGGPGQLFPLSVWWRGFSAAIINRHGFGKLIGDGFQMPGAFLVRDNAIVKAYRHRTSGSRPDYLELAACEVTDSQVQPLAC